MVFIQYKKDQVGPAYSFRMVVRDPREAEYLLQYGLGSLHVIVQSTGEYMNGSSSRYMDYETSHSETTCVANILPDVNSSNDNSENVYASWIVHFSTGDPYSTPKPVSLEMASSSEPKWWTATVLRDQMLPNQRLEKVFCFDFCTEMQVEPVSFRLISEDDDILSIHEEKKLILLQVEIPSLHSAMNRDYSQVDPLVVLPKRQKKNFRISKLNYSAPLLYEPDLNHHMFDESLVLLPKKR